MKIIKKSDANHIDKPEGTSVDYYLQDEYEVHYNEQAPKTTQTWHHHEQIGEVIFMLEGELTAKWKEQDKVLSEIVSSGDLIETGSISHTFENHTDQKIKFLVIKLVPSGENKREIFKTDKIIDE